MVYFSTMTTLLVPKLKRRIHDIEEIVGSEMLYGLLNQVTFSITLKQIHKSLGAYLIHYGAVIHKRFSRVISYENRHAVIVYVVKPENEPDSLIISMVIRPDFVKIKIKSVESARA